MNQQTLSGQWHRLRGKLKAEWAELTNDELDHIEGNMEQLIGLIQQRTGETREVIERKIDQLCETCGEECRNESMADAATHYAEMASETAAAYAKGIASAVHDSSEDISNAVRSGVHQTSDMVRQRPVESLLATFGAGLIAGVVVGLMVRK